MKTQELLIYTNTKGESITFGVGSRYHVNVSKDVTGLSDLDDTIYSTSSMGQHGDTYTGVRIEPRPIKIKGKITERDKSAQIDLRQNALKILNPELAGTLRYYYGSFARKIGAIVDGTPTFTRDLSQAFEVDFKCLDPFWQEETEHREDIATWEAAWEFPTEIDRDDATDMIFGSRSDSVIVDVYNGGHVSIGMRIVFRAIGELTNPMLLNVNTREFIKLNYTMVAGDVVEINTSYGSKRARLTRQGVVSNVYRYLDVDSTFMQLDVGDNVFRYNADTGLDNLECSIYFSPKILGV